MGGIAETTCPAPPPSVKRSVGNPIRSHESKGEMHFHDDTTKIKCAIKRDHFISKYLAWRASPMSNDLVLAGSDGKSGHATVKMTPFVDDDGILQIAQVVKKVDIGDTISAMDKLSGF